MSPIDHGEILKRIRAAGNRPVSTPDLMRDLGLRSSEGRELKSALRTLLRHGEVKRLHGKYWQAASQSRRDRGDLEGTLQVTRRGFGFVRLDAPHRRDPSDDIRVSELDMADALDGDRVVVEVTQRTPRGPRGRIVEVIDRAHKTIIGMYQQTGPSRGEVRPRNSSVPRRIWTTPPDPAIGVRNFDWVEVEVTAFTPFPEPLRGVVRSRIGHSEDPGIDVLLLLRDRGIIEEFPHSVEQAASALSMDVEAEAPKRRDLRGLRTVTIDPKTAKDFDDAISIEPLGDRGWRLWVHIADVSHYVRLGDAIDEEARSRATSVYPVDRVVPMLPEKLSNDLCSLRPREDRLAVTAEMVVRRDGRLGECAFYSSVIHSNHRMAYEQAQAIIADEPGADRETFADAVDLLLAARDCARALRRRRIGRGALDLEIPETEVFFHEDGRVSDLRFAERFEAHMLIEDCMLAANEAVAAWLTQREAPLLYRVHEAADPERLLRLAKVLKALGVTLPVSKHGLTTPRDVQGALDSLKGRRGAHILRRLVLQALNRACYSPENGGHFGLASECYCHFTSPIRRYPDLVVHRQVKALETGASLPYGGGEDAEEDLVALGEHTSFREREAADAERDSTNIKAIEYLKQFEGDEFEGLIAGVQPFGLFVELQPHGVEGLVPVANLPGDRYEIDDLGVQLQGRRSGRAFKLTDAIKVRLIRADPFEGELDLELSEVPPEAPRDTKRRGGGRPWYDAAARGGKQRGRKR